MMNRKQLESTFCWKIAGELRLFRYNILKQEKEEIFNDAYRIDCRQRICDILAEQSGRMSPEELEVCTSISGLLEHLYERWLKEPDAWNEELEHSLCSEIRYLCGDVA